MTDTVLSIGGPVGDAGATEFRNLDSLTFTDASSSMGSWSATVPFEASFADEMFSEVYITNDGDVLFRGQLESFEADYTSGTTSIDGRGYLVDLDRRTEVVTYSNTTVYDALRDAWGTTEYDASVLPPNRALFNKNYGTDGDHRSLWSWDGDSNGGLLTSDAKIERNRLVFTAGNVTLDEYNGDFQQESIRMDNTADRVGMMVETATPVTTMEAAIKRIDESKSDNPTQEEVWDTETHNTPQRYHYFDFQLGTSDDGFRAVLRNGPDPVEVVRTEVFAPDPAGYSTIDEVEIEGTKFEVLQELHDIGSYSFTVRDYDNLNVESFPVGAVAGQPDWSVVSSTRSLDFTDYANVVTVHGRTLDDGTRKTSTATNQSEIDELSQRGVGDDGEVQAFEKNPDLKTQAEVDSRASRLLDESVNERDESGSLEIAPQQVAPGYSYPVSNWGDAFPYGSQIGTNSLYFDGSSYVDVDGQSDNGGGAWTWEFLIHPEGLSTMGDNEYYTLLEYDNTNSIDGGYVRVYGDGSVKFGSDSGDSYNCRTTPDVVREDQSQRLSIVWGLAVDEWKVYADSQLADSFTSHAGPTADPEDTVYRIGAELDGSTGFVGGVDDVRLWFDSNGGRTQQEIFETKDADLINTEADLIDLAYYLRFDDSSDPTTVVNDGEAQYLGSTVTGAQYQDVVGQLEEVQYSLGSGDTVSLDFDVSGRIDTELIETQRVSRSNRRSL